MADGLDPKSIAVTLLLISILFHYFSYSFTVVAYDYSDYDISLDIVELYASGIMIGEYAYANVSFGNETWTLFELNETTVRTRWDSWILTGKSALLFQTEAKFFSFQPWIDFRWQNVDGGLAITNASIIENFEPQYNWTRYHGVTGFVMFVTDPELEGNITRAVMEDGLVTVTIAQDVAWSSEPDLQSFMSWYMGLVTGSESWGLPDSFQILVRIMSMLGIFSGIFLLIEARRLIKVV